MIFFYLKIVLKVSDITVLPFFHDKFYNVLHYYFDLFYYC